MSSLFKITVVQHWLRDCWIDADGYPCPEGTPGSRFVKSRKVKAGMPGAEKVTKKSGKWYGRIPGRSQPVPLSSNKTVALQMLAALVRKAEMGRAGLDDPFEEHGKRALAGHLDDFAQHLRSKGNTGQHVRETVNRAKAVFDGSGAVFPADLDATRAAAFLESMGADRPPVAIPGEEEFKPKDAAALFGWTRATLLLAIRRAGLDEGQGSGKARRIPRATIEAVAIRASQGASPQTVKHHVGAVRAFARWMVRDRRMAFDPLATLGTASARSDIRHARQALTADALRSLLASTRSSARMVFGLSGTDRHALYSLACGTGLRAGAIAGLTPACFSLEGERPSVAVAVRRDKSRKGTVLPLPADLAGLMRGYVSGKPAQVAIWPGKWGRCAADMLRIDLAAAGLPYIVEGTNGPEHADFHSLRHTYLTIGGQSGIDLRTLQELAGHSSPVLTARYSHRRLNDLADAILKLPSFAALAQEDGEQGAPVCRRFAQPVDPEGGAAGRGEMDGVKGAINATGLKCLSGKHLRPVETGRDSAIREAPPGFEPGNDGFAIRVSSRFP